MVLIGCTGEVSGPPGAGGPGPFVPAPATLHRLTRAEHLASLEALFGRDVAVGGAFDLPDETGALPVDDGSNGFSTISGSLLTISPSEVETYEMAAERMMRQAIDPARRDAFFGCDVAAAGDACLRAFVARFGRAAWRRSLAADEVSELVALATNAGTRLRDPWVGAGYAISAILQSPHFLFRIEVGEPDPSAPGRLRYTSEEMASRLSFLVWGAPPDDELLDAGEAGLLVQDAAIETQVRRMLEDPRAVPALQRFFGEFFSLSRLELAQKDPTAFPEWSPELRRSMRTELDGLFGDVVERDEDVRTLLSTDVTFVDDRLAGFYGLPSPGTGVLRTRLPAGERRGGVLGRPGILAMWSHATVTSPTRLGKFVLTSIECEGIGDPPPGQSLEIPTSDERMTLRERLETLHEANPSCNACHSRVDPRGFPFEGFDPMGRSRDTDDGLPIDTAVSFDGVEIEDAAAFGDFLAESPSVGRCFGRRFMRYAVGHRESVAERAGMIEVERAFAEGGYRMRDLVLQVALSPVFRTASTPVGDCAVGQVEACEAACGAGERRCLPTGEWGECTSSMASAEVCNGTDDDCDGATDEMLSRACTTACGEGAEVCSAGAYGACTARTPGTESCNHVDDDCDGSTDEGFGTTTHAVPFSTLASFDPLCDGVTERFGTHCTVAFHAFCAMGDGRCGTSGFGPVESGASEGHAVCIDAAVLDTSWAELQSIHDGCVSGAGYSPPCNAAIHRLCAARGYPTGYGPVRIAGGVQVACVTDGEAIGSTYTELSTFHGGCTTGTRMGPDCNAAMNRFCQARGFVSGFGPLENSGDVAVVGCVR